MPGPRELTFLLAGYEMFLKTVKANYKSLLSEVQQKVEKREKIISLVPKEAL